MRDLCGHQTVAPFQPLNGLKLILHALSKLVDTLRKGSDLTAAFDGDPPGQVSALESMDLFIDRMNVVQLPADSDDYDRIEEQQREQRFDQNHPVVKTIPCDMFSDKIA